MSQDAADIAAHPLLDEHWYYAIELAPGVVTSGDRHLNVALTRRLLAGVDVAGADCLDIGSMEGTISVLLARRGARSVVAYDRVGRNARVELVKSALGVDFDYVSGMPLSGLREALGGRVFDVVVFSGVLYHMFDPMAGLAIARSFVREGGILVVETAAAFESEHIMHLNSRGRFFPDTTYWQMSVGTLEYLLRFVRTKPLDITHYLLPREFDEGRRICRVAATCRAVAREHAADADTWIRQGRNTDFGEFLDWNALRSDAPPVPHTPTCTGLTEDQSRGCDWVQLLAAAGGEKPDGESAVLHLNDTN